MLTFQELICASPFYKADIIGGWNGKDKNFAEVEDATTQLVDSSILIMPSNTETVFQLLDYLSIPSVQGILLYGHDKPYISSIEMDAIESKHKPVMYIKEEINPISIKKTISDLKNLKSLGLFHYVFEHSTNYWLQLIDEQGIIAFIQRLSLLIDQDVYLLDEHFNLHTFHNEPEKRDHFIQLGRIYQHVQREKKPKTEIMSMVKHEDNQYFLFSILSKSQQYGFLLFEEKPNMMLDICMEQVIHTIPALLSYFKKEDAVLRAHQSYKDHFLYNLLYNNIESEQLLIEQGNQWGWDFSKPSDLMVLRFNQKEETGKLVIDTEAIIKKIQSLISARFLQGITFLLQGDIVLIIFNSEPLRADQRKELALSLAGQIHQKVDQDLPDLHFEIGIGRHYTSNKELFRSYYEAKVAIELGKYEMRQTVVRHFEDIGITRLLSNIHRNILHEYYVEVLKEILQDQENRIIYLDTLESFFQNNADINQTAEQLFVHPNTLRKRIKKLESILNADFNQLEDMLEIYVAIKIMKMIK